MPVLASRSCDTCGAMFLPRLTVSRFCSRACFHQALNKANTHYPVTIERICGFCGETFQVSHKKFRQGKGLYCSVHCRAKMAARQPVEERFWSHVHKLDGLNACWLWTGAPTATGYGTLSVYGVITPAHRLSYSLHYGPIPDGFLIRHICPEQPNPLCVNPLHLAPGTYQDNATDAVEVRRQNEAIRFKMTPAIVRRIREFATKDLSSREIALLIGVSHRTVWSIVTRRTWKHIP